MIFWDDMWNICEDIDSKKNKACCGQWNSDGVCQCASQEKIENKMELNYSRLNGEYISWSIEHGDGRNKQDIRFGQYLHTKYNNMKDFTDVFYMESCESVYSTLLDDLYKLEL